MSTHVFRQSLVFLLLRASFAGGLFEEINPDFGSQCSSLVKKVQEAGRFTEESIVPLCNEELKSTQCEFVGEALSLASSHADFDSKRFCSTMEQAHFCSNIMNKLLSSMQVSDLAFGECIRATPSREEAYCKTFKKMLAYAVRSDDLDTLRACYMIQAYSSLDNSTKELEPTAESPDERIIASSGKELVAAGNGTRTAPVATSPNKTAFGNETGVAEAANVQQSVTEVMPAHPASILPPVTIPASQIMVAVPEQAQLVAPLAAVSPPSAVPVAAKLAPAKAAAPPALAGAAVSVVTSTAPVAAPPPAKAQPAGPMVAASPPLAVPTAAILAPAQAAASPPLAEAVVSAVAASVPLAAPLPAKAQPAAPMVAASPPLAVPTAAILAPAQAAASPPLAGAVVSAVAASVPLAAPLPAKALPAAPTGAASPPLVVSVVVPVVPAHNTSPPPLVGAAGPALAASTPTKAAPPLPMAPGSPTGAVPNATVVAAAQAANPVPLAAAVSTPLSATAVSAPVPAQAAAVAKQPEASPPQAVVAPPLTVVAAPVAALAAPATKLAMVAAHNTTAPQPQQQQQQQQTQSQQKDQQQVVPLATSLLRQNATLVVKGGATADEKLTDKRQVMSKSDSVEKKTKGEYNGFLSKFVG